MYGEVRQDVAQREHAFDCLSSRSCPQKLAGPTDPPSRASQCDDDDCCLFSHEKTLGLFEEKKNDVEAKKDRDNHNQNVTSPSSNEILVEYKHRAQAHGRLFRTIKVDKRH